MKEWIAEIENDNFEILIAENEIEVIKELEAQGHYVLEVNEYKGE